MPPLMPGMWRQCSRWAAAGLLTAVFVAMAGDANASLEPSPSADATVYLSDDFESSAWSDRWNSWFPGPLNRAARIDGFSGTGLGVAIPTGSHYGTRFRYSFAAQGHAEPDELYFRYYLKLDDDFGGDGSGKLPGPAGIYSNTGLGGHPSTPDAPGWSARVQFSPGPTDGTSRLGYYIYHLDQPGRFGESDMWDITIRHGEWYCVEGRVGLNTPGHADGVLEAWIDEAPVFAREELSFRRAAETDIAIRSFWFNVYFGGPNTSKHGKDLAFDDVVLAAERVGCGSEPLATTGDFDGDGRDEALHIERCETGRCTITSGGTGRLVAADDALPYDAPMAADTWTLGVLSGDVDGDGAHELIFRGRCASGSTCWQVSEVEAGVVLPPRSWGVQFAPSRETAAIGVVVGDVDGDGLDDLVYRGTCDGRPCWVVQHSTGEGFAAPVDHGDGAYLSAETTVYGLHALDANGDDRTDLVYRGLCGDGRDCWRVQLSLGDVFGPGTSWGNTAGFTRATAELGVHTGDLDGDGRDDIVFRADCGGTECWRALLARTGVFSPRYWGSDASVDNRTLENGLHLGDLDGDDTVDLFYERDCGADTCWTTHLGVRSGFVTVADEDVVDEATPIPSLIRPSLPQDRSLLLS